MTAIQVTVHLLKPAKATVITYTGELLERSDTYMLLRAPWQGVAKDLGFVRLVPGDQFYEYYYTDRWYNVFEIHAPDGTLKGWYCNITRPARFDQNEIESEDLELDLFVPPDRCNPLLLDEDEYAARGFEQHEPATHRAALAAVAELHALVARGAAPFHNGESHEHRNTT